MPSSAFHHFTSLAVTLSPCLSFAGLPVERQKSAASELPPPTVRIVALKLQPAKLALAGQRLNAASPNDSLILLKATAVVPHEGGQHTKLVSDSTEGMLIKSRHDSDHQ